MGRFGAMSSPHVNSCCCFGLEQGTKIIGFLHLIIATGLVILVSYLAVDAQHQMGTINDYGDAVYTRWYKWFCLIAILGSVHIVLAAVLLVGAFNRKTWMLRAWVWVMLFLYVSAIVFIITTTAMHGPSHTGSKLFLAILEGIAFFGFMGYAILCVNSFYLMLKSDEDMSGPQL